MVIPGERESMSSPKWHQENSESIRCRLLRRRRSSTGHLQHDFCILAETAVLNGDHLEEMNECDIKEETVNPCRNNARVDTSSNNEGGHDKENVHEGGGVEFSFDLD